MPSRKNLKSRRLGALERRERDLSSLDPGPKFDLTQKEITTLRKKLNV